MNWEGRQEDVQSNDSHPLHTGRLLSLRESEIKSYKGTHNSENFIIGNSHIGLSDSVVSHFSIWQIW
jgi:hypothetical protein